MKILKLFISLSLILSVSLINSLAAISVSDGSAFVTKAEFAADLNNLSNRMSSLENSLDAKIDSLVSSYLSRNGIWNGEKQTVGDKKEWDDIKPESISISNRNGSVSKDIKTADVISKCSKAGLLTGFFYFLDGGENLNSNDSRWGYSFYTYDTGNWFVDSGLFLTLNVSETLDGQTTGIVKFSSMLGSAIAQFKVYNENKGAWLGFSLPSKEVLIPISFFVSKDSKISLSISEDCHLVNVDGSTIYGYNTPIKLGFKDEFSIY